jgi:transposase
LLRFDDERAELARRAGLPERRRADRARIILACADGMSNAGATQALGVAVKSVSKWRRRFAAQGLTGLEDDAPIDRPKAELVLAEAERAQLIRWARRAKTAQYLALRAKIVLACADGRINKQVAADLGLETVGCPRCRRSAARPKWSSSATATNASSSILSTGPGHAINRCDRSLRSAVRR